MFIDNKIPYQFGDPRTGDFIIFNCEDLGFQYQPSVKTERTNSDLFDGEARLNGDEASKLDDTTIRLRFSLLQSERYTQDYILKLFTGKPQKLFVYEEGEQNNIPIQSVLWQYAECVGLPQVYSGINERGYEYKTYEIELTLSNPEFYECDTTLSYFVAGATYPVADGTYLANGAITAGEYENGSFVSFPTLPQDQYVLLTERVKPLSVLDSYFRVQSYNINNSTSLLTETLTTNTAVYRESTGLDLETSKVAEVYLLQCSPLAINEWVEVENLDTDSDIRITWLFAVANANDLLFSSVDNLLYDPATQTMINPEYYRIDSLTGSPLMFNAKLRTAQVNQYRYANKTTDSLRIQKSSSTNNTVIIQTLKPFI